MIDIKKLIVKYKAMLLPGAVALGAVVLFVPVVLINGSIGSMMRESSTLGSQVQSLLGEVVPEKQWQKEEEYQRLHEQDANTVAMMAKRTSMRELLVYGMFPEPNETSTDIFTNFGKVYRAAIEGLVTAMNARDCPSDMEIHDLSKQAGLTLQASGYSPASGSSDERIIDQICKDRAGQISTYATPGNLCGYEFWASYNYQGVEKAVEDCWKAQVSFWIQKDVTDTIVAINAGSKSVLSSPVKRLIGISFITDDLKSDPSTRAVAGTTPDVPNYVAAASGSASSGSALCAAWTGRTSNDEMDVVHFAVAVVVNAKSVMPFMAQLCSAKPHTFKGWDGKASPESYLHNQITILRSSVEPVKRSFNQGGQVADHYRYGDDAAVQLTVVCEYVFDKAGYSTVRPKFEAKTDTQNAPAAPTVRPPGRRNRSSGSAGKNSGAEE